MARKRKEKQIFQHVTIQDVAAEGKALAKITIPAHDGTEEKQLVVFVPWCVPGDVVDIKIYRKKHNYAEGIATHYHKLSDKRTKPQCQHFGTCGGCKWQQLPYELQLKAKQQQVYDQLHRIGHLNIPQPETTDSCGCQFLPIKGSIKQYHYRNKLDYGCSNKTYLTQQEIDSIKESCDNLDNTLTAEKNKPAIGFHVTGAFDKILPITQCHLMDQRHNDIRNETYKYCIDNNVTFFDIKQQNGLLRDIIIRHSNTDEWMVIYQFKYGKNKEDDKKQAEKIMQHIAQKFPYITSLLYVDNQKQNDTIADQNIYTYKGKDHIIETMEQLKFKVGPKSFYQTNTEQAYQLYKIVRQLALDKTTQTQKPLIYDLYTGTGTIANFVAQQAEKVIGIEYVPEAIEDAKINSEINNISNTQFYAGDMKDILTDDFISQHGKPDIIITDPPRAGMHPDVVKTILRATPQKIIYVSCNPATQARDLEQLTTQYRIKTIQPVDMFPHTPHVENVVALERL